MKIGIDARLYKQTGVGRYIRNIISGISHRDPVNEYVVYLGPDGFDEFELPNRKWQKKLVRIGWHGIAEQLLLPLVYLKDRLDLLHIPYFNIPVLYPGKMVVTIHDLTIHNHATGRASTLPPLVYGLKLIGYKLVFAFGLYRSKKIIAVSQAVAADIKTKYRQYRDKITVIYEGVDPVFQKTVTGKRPIAGEYFLYVGNFYPHKNLENMLNAFRTVIQTNPDIKLVLIGPEDFFSKRIRSYVTENNLGQNVIMTGKISDRELPNYYKHALALVFVSKSEGFGLPALESLICGRIAVVSDLPIFHEILGTEAIFVKPDDMDDLSRVMKLIISKPDSFGVPVSTKNNLLKKFNWDDASNLTLKLYGDCK